MRTAPTRLRRTPIGKKLRLQVLERDGFTCRYCGKIGAQEELHVDHVQSVARGGKNVWANLVTACLPCNLSKGAHGGGWLIDQAIEAQRLAPQVLPRVHLPHTRPGILLRVPGFLLSAQYGPSSHWQFPIV